jgi:hypothetical protein
MFMNQKLLIIKIKFLEKEIQEAVDWNFGYDPSNDPEFDKTLAKRDELLNIIRKQDEKLYWRIWESFDKKNWQDLLNGIIYS